MELKVYVANLAKYNEGELVGEWLELPMSEEELNEALKNILGSDEEYAIHDYECDFEGIKINEYNNLNKLNNLAERIENLDQSEQDLLEAILEYDSYYLNNIEETIDNLDDWTLYEDIENEYDLGYYMVNEAGIYDLSKMGNLANYIDYEAFGRDINLETEGGFTSKGWLEKR